MRFIWSKKFEILRKMDIENELGHKVDIEKEEWEEQKLAGMYIKENDIVLELGARYGSVSCIINSKLKNKLNQVVVEPDNRVWSVLERNRHVNNCEFHIVKGFISRKKLGLENLDNCRGYGTTFVEETNSIIPSFTLEEVKEQYNLKFNVLVADCEGFLETFLDENPTIYDDIRLIIFEADYPDKSNYNNIYCNLQSKGFIQLVWGFQNVWIKS
jgi:FkbM family methyltransferase